MGKKRQPIYKIVVADARSPRDGKYIEAVGLYNPVKNPATVEVVEDRVMYWLGCGAQPTDTVKNIISKKGILLRRELAAKGLSQEQINEEVSKWLSQKEAKAAQTTPKTKKKAKADADGAQQ